LKSQSFIKAETKPLPCGDLPIKILTDGPAETTTVPYSGGTPVSSALSVLLESAWLYFDGAENPSVSKPNHVPARDRKTRLSVRTLTGCRPSLLKGANLWLIRHFCREPSRGHLEEDGPPSSRLLPTKFTALTDPNPFSKKSSNRKSPGVRAGVVVKVFVAEKSCPKKIKHPHRFSICLENQR